jgi:hypothetical protein
MALAVEHLLAGLGPANRSMYSLHFITKDNLIYEHDAGLNIEISRLMADRGIQVSLGKPFSSIDSQHGKIKLSDGEELRYDSLFVEPEMSPSSLFINTASQGIKEFKAPNGVYLTGECTKGLFGLVSEDSVERQAQFISNQLRGIKQDEYTHSSTQYLYLGGNKVKRLHFDEYNKIRFIKDISVLDRWQERAKERISQYEWIPKFEL